jgi:amidase
VSLRDREALMGEARLAEAALRRRAQGWHGLPVAVKDLVDVKGLPHDARARRSSRGRCRRPTPGSWRGLRAAGAIVIGKTNVPMFGLGSHSTNPVFGVTRNPYDRRARPADPRAGRGRRWPRDAAVADGSDMMGSPAQPGGVEQRLRVPPDVGLIPPSDAGRAVVLRISTLGRWRARSATCGCFCR